jgi:hypothetical protein
VIEMDQYCVMNRAWMGDVKFALRLVKEYWSSGTTRTGTFVAVSKGVEVDFFCGTGSPIAAYP